MILTGVLMALMVLGSMALLGRKMFAAGDAAARHVSLLIPFAMVVAVGVYIIEGAFGVADRPLADRTEEIAEARESAAAQEDIDRTAFEQAQQAVDDRPDDLEARFALAEAAAMAGEFAVELETLNHILTITGDASLHAMIAEALTREAGGIVTLKALEAAERGLSADAGDWRARYFKALYLSQNDNDQGALDIWVPLAEELFGSPVYPAVAAAIEQSAERLGLDIDSLLPQTQAELSGDDILAMVGSLETRLLNGDTHEEREAWIMLTRSMIMIDDQARLDRALQHYLSLDLAGAEDSAVIMAMAEMLLPAENMPETVPDILPPLVNKARDLTPQQPTVLFFSGLVARQQNNLEEMVTYWGQLRALISDDNPLAALLDEELKAAAE